ncbi:hypothetical protein VNI00_015207 [Paramarasmius palmivorus]|uniref:Uncharacterized protein n=1 Tax=Paramarasmius palmivorus TaxID=297713 RepID=A0AAW0BNG5_9AGAR
MPNPGAFQGIQLSFLEGELPGYRQARQDGVGPEFLADVVRRFMLQFPIAKGPNYQPSQQELDAVDLDQPYPELKEPTQPEGMSDEDYEQLLEEWQKLKDAEAFKIKQIQRWFHYRFLNATNVKHGGPKEPDGIDELLTSLTGRSAHPPRRRPAWAVFATENATTLEAKVKLRVKEEQEAEAARENGESTEDRNTVDKVPEKTVKDSVHADAYGSLSDSGTASQPNEASKSAQQPTNGKKGDDKKDKDGKGGKVADGKQKNTKKSNRNYLRIRQQVIRDEFVKLSKTEQDKYFVMAKKQHDEAVLKWKAEKAKAMPTDPESHQRCIDRITSFIQPILAGLTEATGWPCTLIAGGPEPADNGRLNMLSVHSGETKDPTPLNFGTVNRVLYQKNVVPAFTQFLLRMFTPEDCRAMALENAGPSVATMVGDEATVDRIEAFGEPVGDLASSSKMTPSPATAFTQGSKPQTVSNPPRKHTRSSEHFFSNDETEDSRLPSAKTATRGRATLPGTSKFKPTLVGQGSAARSSLAVDTNVKNSGRMSAATTPELSPVFPSPPPPSSPMHSSRPPSRTSTRASSPSLSVRTTAKRKAPRSASESSGRSSSPIDIDMLSSPEGDAKALPRQASTSSIGASKSTRKSTFIGVVLPARPAPASSRVGSVHKRSRVQDPGSDGEDVKMEEVEPGLENSELRSEVDCKSEVEDDMLPPEPPSSQFHTRSLLAPHQSFNTPSTSTPRLTEPTPTHDGFNMHRYVVDVPKSAREEEYILRILELAHFVGIDHKLRSIILAFLGLEKKNSYQPQHRHDRLTSTDRPDAIAEWIGRARKVTYLPIFFLRNGSIHLPGLEEYAEEFAVWYTNCQPTWRVDPDFDDFKEGSLAFPKADKPHTRERWRSLYKTGSNGVVSIIAALCWWKEAIQRLPTKTPRQEQVRHRLRNKYSEAIGDVEYVMWALEGIAI